MNNWRIIFQIDEESNSYSDIVQADFSDTYLNLTLKSLVGLKWGAEFCSGAEYFMKTDDDMFINVPRLLEHLHAESKSKPSYITGKEFSVRNL